MAGDSATEPLEAEAEAEYQDGEQASPLSLRARLSPSSLELRRTGGAPVAAWPVSALRVVDRAGGALRLAPDGSDARVLVSDPSFAAALDAALRPRRRAATARRLRLAALAAVAVPAVAAGLWLGWPLAADAIARAVPVEWERSIGTATAAALVGSTRVCDAPEGQAALDGLSARLAAAGGVSGPVRVRVLDRPTVNALAAPGGEVLVYRGLLDLAGSAEEVAGVLAHELAHVRHRHGLRSVARVAGLFVLTSALTGGSDAAGLAAALVGLSYSRGFEREADAEGARALAAAGIGTEGLAAFFARLERDGPAASSGSIWDYVRTHPADADRVAALRAAARPAAPAPALSAPEWAALRRVCGGPGDTASGERAPRRAAGARAAERTRDEAAAPRSPRGRIGLFGGWEAWAGQANGEGACHAMAWAQSEASVGEGFRLSMKGWILVTHRPSTGLDEVAFQPGSKVPPGAEARIAFGDRTFPVRWRQAGAQPGDEAALSAALRAAAAAGVAEATVSVTDPADGSAAVRSYHLPLHGLAEAHAAMARACPAAERAPSAVAGPPPPRPAAAD